MNPSHSFRSHPIQRCFALLRWIPLLPVLSFWTAPLWAQDASLRVAAILPGSINDQSWNSYAYEGLQQIKANFGAEIAYSENVQPADQIDAIRDYVNRGYNVVFVHGGQFEDAALTVAADAPEVDFLVTAGAQGNGSNVTPLDVDRVQMVFGQGYLAASMSESGKLGMVTSLEGIPPTRAATCAFRAGAKFANPDVETTVVYLPDMEDVARAREATLTLIGNGADYVQGDLNRGIQGVLDVAQEQRILTMGRVPAHAETYPEGVLTLVVEDWASMYPAMVALQQADKLTGEPTYLGLGDGFRYIYGDGDVNPIVPEEVAIRWREVVEQVGQGEITVEIDDQCSRAGTQ
ncbi:MAG: BMP family protein [Cyanobacteriota bacterium]